MSKPINPSNRVNLGGLEFESNDATSYGKAKAPLKNAGSGGYYINFKDGTKVFYPEQPKSDVLFPSIELNSGYKDVCINGLSGAEILSPSDDVLLTNCENVKITHLPDSYANQLEVCDSTDITVRAGDVSNYVYLDNVDGVDVDTGAGPDHIMVETNIYGESNNTNNALLLNPTKFPQNNGTVKLDNDDVLFIVNQGTTFEDSYEGNVHELKTESARAEVVVKGEGVHNLAQTPIEAFEVERRTTVVRTTSDFNRETGEFEQVEETIVDKTWKEE